MILPKDVSFIDIIAARFKKKDRRGRPRSHATTDILSAIFYVLRNGCAWRSLPKTFPPYQTVHRYFVRWNKEGLFKKIWKKVIVKAERKGRLKLDTCFIDATFIRSKAGKDLVGKTRCGKGHKLMAIVDRRGVPIALNLCSASPAESKLVGKTLDARVSRKVPKKMLGDKAYDSDPLDRSLRKRRVEMVAPHRKNRKKLTQDRRKLRSYRERWKVEDFNRRIQEFRRICIRYEKRSCNLLGFIHIAASWISALHLGYMKKGGRQAF